MMYDELSIRKRSILRHVIQQYVREVHPVSSKQLAEEIRVSSATVRNELKALEEMGFLAQPHTSGGRIPTDNAYRFFVEELIEQLSTTLESRARVADVYRQLSRETEVLFESTLDLLTESTGYVAWVSLPGQSVLSIKAINFVETGEYELVIMLVTSSGASQSKLVTSSVPVRQLELGKVGEALNNYLRNRSVLEVDYEHLKQLFMGELAVPESLLRSLHKFLLGLGGSTDKIQFGNMLQLALQPEFSQVDELSNVISALKNREQFIATLRQQFNERRVQTIIGSENLNEELHNCSLIVSRYPTPAGGDGTVGILGPTRLAYDRTLPLVRAIGEAVAKALSGKHLTGGDN